MSFFNQYKINDSNVRSSNPMTLVEFIEKLTHEEYLKKRLKEYHKSWSTPIKGTLSEELWTKIFNEDFGFGEECDGSLFGWVPESHKVGADMIVPSLETKRISIKAGQISKIGRKKGALDIREDHRLKYSSHRMTKHGELSEKINFLSIPHSDVTFCLSPNIKYGRYYLIILGNIDYQSINWCEAYSKTGKHTGWCGDDDNQGVINTRISKSLSSQLWIEMKLSSNRIIHIEEICN